MEKVSMRYHRNVPQVFIDVVKSYPSDLQPSLSCQGHTSWGYLLYASASCTRHPKVRVGPESSSLGLALTYLPLHCPPLPSLNLMVSLPLLLLVLLFISYEKLNSRVRGCHFYLLERVEALLPTNFRKLMGDGVDSLKLIVLDFMLMPEMKRVKKFRSTSREDALNVATLTRRWIKGVSGSIIHKILVSLLLEP